MMFTGLIQDADEKMEEAAVEPEKPKVEVKTFEQNNRKNNENSKNSNN